MRLKRPLPPGRTLDQVLHHYEVEKGIAQRLKASTRSERKQIYRSMYDELFREVPDHPRVVRRTSREAVGAAVESKLLLVRKLLRDSSVFVEFGPGDCTFAAEVSKRVAFVYGVDISDQRKPGTANASNFQLVVYDGYDLGLEESSVDVVFSDQLIEHFHPEDTPLHFQIVKRILRPGGIYILRTPHRFNGPHDVSKFFSDEAECFHLREWSYGELGALLDSLGYSRWRGYWQGGRTMFELPRLYWSAVEGALGFLPAFLRRSVSRLFLPQLVLVAVK